MDATVELDKFECFFLPNSGAYFNTYVTIVALVGNSFELLKLTPNFFLYLCYRALAKSKAEIPQIYDQIRGEFYFGESYAQMILIFNITILFSFSFPLIIIPALLYFLGKHCVDRHNILYFHEITYVHHKVHLAVIKYFIMAPFFQLCLLTFQSLLSQYYHQVGYGCTLILLAIIIWFALDRIKFIEVDQITDEEMTNEILDEMKNYQYFPSVLSGKDGLNI